MTDGYDWTGTGAQTPGAEQPFTSKFSLRGKVGGVHQHRFWKKTREKMYPFLWKV